MQYEQTGIRGELVSVTRCEHRTRSVCENAPSAGQHAKTTRCTDELAIPGAPAIALALEITTPNGEVMRLCDKMPLPRNEMPRLRNDAARLRANIAALNAKIVCRHAIVVGQAVAAPLMHREDDVRHAELTQFDADVAGPSGEVTRIARKWTGTRATMTYIGDEVAVRRAQPTRSAEGIAQTHSEVMTTQDCTTATHSSH
jgi:hypothetical protein